MTNNRVESDGDRRRHDSLSAVVAEKIRRAIAEGEYPPGARLPPEPVFAEQTGVSRGTLREALKQLQREGLVIRRQRMGTAVSTRPFVQHSLDRNYGVRDIIEASGKEYGIRDAQITFMEASPQVANALNVEPGAPITVLERTRTADERPVVLTTDHLESRIVQRATAPLLPDVSLYEWLKTHCGILVAHGLAHVAAISASEALATQLSVPAGAPIFRLQQVDYTASGEPVLYSQEFHVADAFEVTVIRNGPYS